MNTTTDQSTPKIPSGLPFSDAPFLDSAEARFEASPTKVAIMVGNGSDGPMVRKIYTALLAQGAAPRLVGSKLGKIHANDKSVLYIENTLEDEPWYDALVVPDGADAIAGLSGDEHALNFVRAQYRDGKPMLAVGAGTHLLTQAGALDMPRSEVIGAGGADLMPALVAFKTALVFARESQINA
ncbi:MAG: DJ-1/PfpI family protein [Massilia sp.]